MSEERYQRAFREVVSDLRERRKQGAPSGDPYKIGFNAGLWNALLSIEGAAAEAGIDLHEIGLHQGWADQD